MIFREDAPDPVSGKLGVSHPRKMNKRANSIELRAARGLRMKKSIELAFIVSVQWVSCTKFYPEPVEEARVDLRTIKGLGAQTVNCDAGGDSPIQTCANPSTRLSATGVKRSTKI
jgi:hypothetical protein